MSQKEGYINYEEYSQVGEPQKAERAYAWSTAIGLQAVDGLTVSQYLKDTAIRNIEGEITIDEARELIKTYYQTKTSREPDDEEKQEADRVSGNIAKILAEQSFSFSVPTLISIHRHIFEGVFKHAGQLRTYDITKKEWVLRGDTVLYGRSQDLRMALEYDMEQERQFDYSGLNMGQVVEHLAKFVSGIWQIHPFREGNTRTTAVFTIKYLRSIGFDVTNHLFSIHSWYFRNALVRANYQNIAKGIQRDTRFLEHFFRNLLMGEKNELRNRYMLVNLPEELAAPASTPASTPSSTPSSTPASTPSSTPASAGVPFTTDNENILRLVNAIGHRQLSVKEMLAAVGLKDRMNFMEYSLIPAMAEGFVCLLYPDKPQHPRQKYLLTVKGSALYNELTKDASN
ncbi:MAG: Fic family protein [Paraprevotella sp.]|nr:Fic family protein [Paraprevotella sp.]